MFVLLTPHPTVFSALLLPWWSSQLARRGYSLSFFLRSCSPSMGGSASTSVSTSTYTHTHFSLSHAHNHTRATRRPDITHTHTHTLGDISPHDLSRGHASWHVPVQDIALTTKSHGGSGGFDTHGPLQDLITSPAGHHTHALDYFAIHTPEQLLAHDHGSRGRRTVCTRRNAPSTHRGG